jgi:hypothetical protein
MTRKRLIFAALGAMGLAALAFAPVCVSSDVSKTAPETFP